MQADAPLIQLSGVGMQVATAHGPLQILKSIDLTVTAGETLAITGPSGSGKSTLLMLLGGLERATTGQVRVDGVDLTPMTEDALASLRRARMGIVFQSFHLFPTLTALENVCVPLELAGVSDARARATAELQAVGLGARLGHYPAQLSGGEQQRVALARALAPRPALVLADEPTGNLDHSTGQMVAGLLFDLVRARGATLVLVTHDPALAARCSRVLHMRDGQLQPDQLTGGAA